MDNVSATVNFPKNANYLGVDVFSGSFVSEANGLNVSYLETSDGISFQGTDFFKCNQGLTARIKYEPSLLPKPYFNSNFAKRLTFIILSINVILVTALMWYRVGKKNSHSNCISPVLPT